MRRNGFIETLIVILGGVMGYALRTQELSTVFEESTRLAKEGEPATIALIVLSVIICALLFVSGLFTRNRVSMNFNEAFGYNNLIICLILCICGGVMTVIAGQSLMVTNMNVKDMLWSILTVLSGIAIVFIAIKTYRGARESAPSLSTMVPVLSLCAWLIFSYTDRAADPVLLNYVYEFFALAFAIMGFYYISGFAFGKMRVRSTLICSRIAVYFVMVNLADDIPTAKRIIYICLAIVLIIQSDLLQKNANSSRFSSSGSQKPEPETPEIPIPPETPNDFLGDFD